MKEENIAITFGLFPGGTVPTFSRFYPYNSYVQKVFYTLEIEA